MQLQIWCIGFIKFKSECFHDEFNRYANESLIREERFEHQGPLWLLRIDTMFVGIFCGLFASMTSTKYRMHVEYAMCQNKNVI